MFQSGVLQGRALRRSLNTAEVLDCVGAQVVPLVKYWRKRTLLFSLAGRCQGLPARAKNAPSAEQVCDFLMAGRLRAQVPSGGESYRLGQLRKGRVGPQGAQRWHRLPPPNDHLAPGVR